MKNNIELHEIKDLSYTKFRSQINKIESCINEFFASDSFTTKELYRVLNLIIYGVDISLGNNLSMLKSYNKCITQAIQTFYIKEDKPPFVLTLQMELDETSIVTDLHSDYDILFYNIRIKLFK